MMELAAIVVLLVGPDIVLTTSMYSDIVADHENWCPPRGKQCLYGGYHPNATRCCGYCDCDLEECTKYGTCCLSAYGSIDAARERISKSLYRCVNPSMYRYDEIKNPTQLIGYQLISVCNSSSPNPTIRDLCENPDVDTNLDTLFPIADHSSNLVYRNQYCALCDEYADLDKISRWFMDIKCNTTVALTYERMLHIIKERQCSVTFKKPIKYAIQSCIPYTISTCNETGQWRVYNETLDTACNSFVDPFNFTFKNVFCFLCNIDNREPIDLPNCADSSRFHSLGSFSRKPPPFLAIRNFDAILTEQRSKQMQCKEHSQYRDDKLGVCRDIQCDRTQYLSFDGNCELNPEPHKNQDCYMIFYKNTPLDFRLLKLNVKSLMEQPMNATDIEMYAKESDTDKRYVEYFIIKLLVEYLNYVKDVLSLFQSRLVRMYGFDMLIELVSYDESLFNGQYRIEVPNKDSGGKDVLVKLKTDFPKDTESCVNKDMVYVDHLLACPFVQLKFEEVHMNFINGSLIFLDTYNMSLPPLKYRIENENILICLSDYVVVYDKLPEMARNKELATLIFTEISAKHLISLQCICVLLTLF